MPAEHEIAEVLAQASSVALLLELARRLLSAEELADLRDRFIAASNRSHQS